MDDPLFQFSKNNPLEPGMYMAPLWVALSVYSGGS
eukprot:COSAG01_NODE_31068_length_604_cov_1.118812_2_plen_34_part_01